MAYYFHLRMEMLYKGVAGLFGMYCMYLSYQAYLIDGRIMIESSDNYAEPESKRINLFY